MHDYHLGDVPNLVGQTLTAEQVQDSTFGQPPNTPTHDADELVTITQRLWRSAKTEPIAACTQVVVMPPVGEWQVTSVECP